LGPRRDAVLVAGGFDSSFNAVADTALAQIGLDAAERATLATMYPTLPQPVWRVSMTHFSARDINWGFSPPPNAGPPPPQPPLPPEPPPDPCTAAGSIIECESQILAEDLPIAGTPFTLRYQSEKTAGRLPELTIPIADAGGAPSSVKRVEVTIAIAGRSETIVVNPPIAPNQSVVWTWDRKDAYGRVSTVIRNRRPCTASRARAARPC
jgi:hypothetical protein